MNLTPQNISNLLARLNKKMSYSYKKLGGFCSSGLLKHESLSTSKTGKKSHLQEHPIKGMTC